MVPADWGWGRSNTGSSHSSAVRDFFGMYIAKHVFANDKSLSTVELKYDRYTKHNPTMASAASPSAADPKMADPFKHTAQASSSDGCAEDRYFKHPIQPNIDGDIWLVSGWVFVGFWVGRPLTRD